jgi:hypothetical protein
MSILSVLQQIDFKINKEQYRIIEVKINEGLHIGTVLCLTERWKWREDIKCIEPDIVQFLGQSTEDIFKQCNEYLKITVSEDVLIKPIKK